jgi:adenosylmethionine-8-amino-7-oxononanoate aminotransferase
MSQENSRILHRNPAEALPRAIGGEGLYLIGENGTRYLDASGGAAVSCLGHGHPRVIAAIKAQLDRLAYAHSAFFTTDVTENLATRLIADAPDGMTKVLFVSGGSEGVEAALKLARQAALERGEPARRHLITRQQSYHGATLGALAASSHPARRAGFEPFLFESHQIAPCHAYRAQAPGETPEAYGRRAAALLEAKITALGPDNVLAFMAETVVGATLGAAPPAPGYFRHIREICDRHGVLLILDEVMCGMGRTGTLHACEQDGVVPDLLVLAKGLGAGYQPIGAVLIGAKVMAALEAGSGAFRHSHTYMGHASACAAALAVQEIITEDGLLANVRARGATLRALLDAHLGQHPHVGDIRGRGLFLGLELVAERDTKRPFAASQNLALEIKRAAMAHGLLCYPSKGSADGVQGDHVLLAPPFIATDADLEEIVARLVPALERAFKTVVP